MCHRRCSKAYVKKVGTLGSSVPNMFLCHSVKKKKSNAEGLSLVLRFCKAKARPLC